MATGSELLQIDADTLREIGFMMGAQQVSVLHNVDEPVLNYRRDGQRASLKAKAGTFVILRFPGSDGDTVEQVENAD